VGHDLFFSYARSDRRAAEPLWEALRGQGVRVFVDEQAIEPMESITERIAHDLGRCKAFVAFYSDTYPNRRACQWELTAAWLAAEHAGDPLDRVFAVNPTQRLNHIHPARLRDANQPTFTQDRQWYTRVAQAIADRTRRLHGTLGEVVPLARPNWFPFEHAGSPRYVGRIPDLWRIHDALHPDRSALTTGTHDRPGVQVRGLGGVGKSLLAEEYALRFGAAYPGGVYWVQALGSGDSGQRDVEASDGVRAGQLRDIAESSAIPLPAGTQLGSNELRGLLAEAIERRGQPCLWVVDDLPGGLKMEEVRSWFAPHPLAVTLITTRSAEYTSVRWIPLDVLSEDDGLELLCHHRRPVDDDDLAAARELVAELGGHSLAIDVTGATLRRQTGMVTFGGYLEALRESTIEELEIAGRMSDVLPTGHEPSIVKTLLRSIHKLGDEGADFLRLASTISVAPIPAELVMDVFYQADDLDEPTARRYATAALGQVEGRSLASLISQEGDWRVHALVSQTVRHVEGDSARRTQLHLAVVHALSRALLRLVEDPQLHLQLGNHAEHARQIIREASSPTDAQLGLHHTLFEFEVARGSYQSAAALARSVIEHIHRTAGDTRWELAWARRDLAWALYKLGQLNEARAVSEQAIDSLSRIVPVQVPEFVESGLALPHTGLHTIVNNHGLILRDLGDLDGAMAHYEWALAILGSTHGPVDDDVAAVLNNMGQVLRDRGDLEAAEARYRESLNLREGAHSDHHPSLAAPLTNLASIFEDRGQLAAARTLRERVLAIEIAAYGEAHPEVATTRINLAVALAGLGERHGARVQLERALEALEASYGPDHPAVLHALASLGAVASEEGQRGEARSYLQRAVDIPGPLEGPDRAAMAGALRNLATLDQNEGNLMSAVRLYERALTLQRSHYGEIHERHVEVLYQGGMALGELGELAASVDWLQQAQRILSILESDGTPRPRLRMQVDTELAQAFRGLADFAAAKPLLERALRVYADTDQDDLYVLARMSYSLGDTLYKLGDRQNAREAYWRSLQAFSEGRCGTDEELARLHYDLGAIALAYNELDSARQHLERAWTLESRVFGPTDPVLSPTLQHLGGALVGLGQFRDALAVLDQALRIDEGRDSWSVLGTLIFVIIAQYRLGNRDQWLTARRRALSILTEVPPPTPEKGVEIAKSFADTCLALGDAYAARTAYVWTLSFLLGLPDPPLFALEDLPAIGEMLGRLGDLHHGAVAFEIVRTLEAVRDEVE
jgi:tetratricopeptide (TPR) repeat protein